jgi:DnaJ-class molecular chaperone
MKVAAAGQRNLKGHMTLKIKEHTCPGCSGTGFAPVRQPVEPGRKIYPAKCEPCKGKGRITDAD